MMHGQKTLNYSIILFVFYKYNNENLYNKV